MTRVVIGLQPNADATTVKQALTKLGAQHLSGPDASHVVVASTDRGDLDAFLTDVRAVRGVRYAEGDAWQSTM